MGQTKEYAYAEVDVLDKELNFIVVYNDDVNTFDHVINTFCEVLKHEVVQAEQCAWIIHTKGKCKVKEGSYDKLNPLCTAILDRGIFAEIQ
jgi:ATP-dependent Clp protease adaptor protein ClpS